MRIVYTGAILKKEMPHTAAVLDMTKEMCLEALGYPCEENSSETALGKFDIWTYDCLWYNAGLVSNLTYITFTDGKISGITN